MWVAWVQVLGIVWMIHDLLKITHAAVAVDQHSNRSRLKGQMRENNQSGKRMRDRRGARDGRGARDERRAAGAMLEMRH